MDYNAYVTISGENKILRFALDIETGKLQLQSELPLEGGPGPLAVDPKQQFLYAGLRSSNEIASFRLDNGGDLVHLGTVSLEANPCYLATDQSGRFLLAAYYGAGQVTVHAIDSDGRPSAQTIQSIPTDGHAHCIQTDRSNRFAFVPHTLPADAIFQFGFEAITGRLTPNAEAPIVSGDGAGPRHFVFHPSRDLVYASNENASSVTAYRLDSSSGTLTAFHTLSTLPASYSGENPCAQIQIQPTGKFLYVSNRGHDSIAIFEIDEKTGRLTSLGQQLTEPIPRVFNLDPTGKYLYAAGQGSGRLAAYRINGQTGALESLAQYPVGRQPMWVLILGL